MQDGDYTVHLIRNLQVDPLARYSHFQHRATKGELRRTRHRDFPAVADVGDQDRQPANLITEACEQPSKLSEDAEALAVINECLFTEGALIRAKRHLRA